MRKKFPTPEQIFPGICLCGCGQATRRYTSSHPSTGAFVGYYQAYIKGHSPKERAAQVIKPPPRQTSANAPGSANRNWRGGFWVDKFGYRWVHSPNHPHNNKGYVLESRLVMEQHLGRYLVPRTERVHHLNHDTLDNRIENLAVVSPSEHAHIHLRQKRRPQSPEVRQATRERVQRIWAERKAGLRPMPRNPHE